MISRRIEFNYSLNIRSDDISITPYIRLVLGRDPLTSLRTSDTIAISLKYLENQKIQVTSERDTIP